MSYTTVRISETTRALLRSLAAVEHRPMQAIVEAALEAYRRAHFLRQVNAGYTALREDEEAWDSMVGERAAWERALADGLPPERRGARQGKAKMSCRRREA